MSVNLSSLFAALLNVANKTHPAIDTAVLNGLSFCIAIDELPQDISIRIDNGRVIELEETFLPDVTISGSLKAVVYMITNERDGLESDELYIAGKISTARQFQAFLASFSLDWQLFFSQFMSDQNASRLAEALEQGLHAARGGAEQLAEGLKNYIVDDKQWVVKQKELSKLSRDIQSLHQRLDELLTGFEIR